MFYANTDYSISSFNIFLNIHFLQELLKSWFCKKCRMALKLALDSTIFFCSIQLKVFLTSSQNLKVSKEGNKWKWWNGNSRSGAAEGRNVKFRSQKQKWINKRMKLTSLFGIKFIKLKKAAQERATKTEGKLLW